MVITNVSHEERGGGCHFGKGFTRRLPLVEKIMTTTKTTIRRTIIIIMSQSSPPRST